MKYSNVVRRAAVLTASAVLGATLAMPASAATYMVDGVAEMQFPAPTTPPVNAPWGPDGYPGDTIELQSYNGTFNLTPGITTHTINMLDWTIDYTYGGTATDPYDWSDVITPFSLDREITIGGVTGTLSQTGQLTNSWDNDYVTIDEGVPLTLLALGYKIVITPLGLDFAGSDFSGSNPWEQPNEVMTAQFEISAVPLPATLPLLAFALGGFGLIVRRRRDK